MDVKTTTTYNFDTIEARNVFVDAKFPVRCASQTCGFYTLPNWETLSVFCEEVTHTTRSRAEKERCDRIESELPSAIIVKRSGSDVDTLCREFIRDVARLLDIPAPDVASMDHNALWDAEAEYSEKFYLKEYAAAGDFTAIWANDESAYTIYKGLSEEALDHLAEWWA